MNIVEIVQLTVYLGMRDIDSRSVPTVGVVSGIGNIFAWLTEGAAPCGGSGSGGMTSGHSCPNIWSTLSRVDFPAPTAPTHKIMATFKKEALLIKRGALSMRS